MDIRVERRWPKPDYTIGRIYVDGNFVCNSLEPPVKPTKLHPKGAIPAGRYELTMSVISPKYSKKTAYAWCKGRLPRLIGVPGFSGILFHAGNTVKDTAGCILTGENKVKGGLVNSTVCLKKLWKILDDAAQKGEKIYVMIEN